MDTLNITLWPPEPLRERNEENIALLVKYVRYAMDEMGLKDWQFNISEIEAPDGNIAQMEAWGDSMTMTLNLGELFWRYGPRMQREVIVHELVHCHTDKMYRRAREVMRKTLGREAYEIAVDSLDQAHELAVDGIAAAWARRLPFIDPKQLTNFDYPEYEQQLARENADKKDKAEG